MWPRLASCYPFDDAKVRTFSLSGAKTMPKSIKTNSFVDYSQFEYVIQHVFLTICPFPLHPLSCCLSLHAEVCERPSSHTEAWKLLQIRFLEYKYQYGRASADTNALFVVLFSAIFSKRVWNEAFFRRFIWWAVPFLLTSHPKKDFPGLGILHKLRL